MVAPRATASDWLKYIVAFIFIIAIVYFALLAMDAYTPEAFALLAATLVAGIFERFGWLKDSWDKLTPEVKQLIMAIFLAVLVFGAFGLSCANLITAFPCTWPDGFMSAVLTFLIAVGVNQGVHRLLHKKV